MVVTVRQRRPAKAITVVQAFKVLQRLLLVVEEVLEVLGSMVMLAVMVVPERRQPYLAFLQLMLVGVEAGPLLGQEFPAQEVLVWEALVALNQMEQEMLELQDQSLHLVR